MTTFEFETKCVRFDLHNYWVFLSITFILSPDLQGITNEGINICVDEYEKMTNKEKSIAKKIIKLLISKTTADNTYWKLENKTVLTKIVQLAISLTREMRSKEDVDTTFVNYLEEIMNGFKEKDAQEQRIINLCNDMKKIKETTDRLLYDNYCDCNAISKFDEDNELIIMFAPCDFS
jgi:hypothetical protein